MVCLIVRVGWRPGGRKPRAVWAILLMSVSPLISMFGNSQRCALTTPAGLCRTRKREFRLMTKAINRREVARARREVFGSKWTMRLRWATQLDLSGQSEHRGFFGVQ